LQAALNDGCISRDVQLYKPLFIVLLSALGCTSGEVSLTDRYTVEYMIWSHIELNLATGRNTVDNLQADVTLCFEKGKGKEVRLFPLLLSNITNNNSKIRNRR
jgi:hypothetical protein